MSTNVYSRFYKKHWWNSWKYCILVKDGYRNVLVDYWTKHGINVTIEKKDGDIR